MAYKKCKSCNGLGWIGTGSASPVTTEERFMSRVNKTKTCWLWTGVKSKSGYGYFFITRNNRIRAHRWSYQNKNGPVSNNIFVCHTCDVRLCVNPDHLFLGTVAENIKDMVKKGRHKSKLKAKDIPKIRGLLSERVPMSVIAKTYGVSPETICLIKNKKTWVHVK